MKKIYLLSILIGILSIFLFQCKTIDGLFGQDKKKDVKTSKPITSKNKKIVLKPINPLPEFIKIAGLTEVSNNVDEEPFEQGIAFTPLVHGTMYSISAKLPVANNKLRVTVWDVINKKALLTDTIGVSVPNSLITKELKKPLNLLLNKQYLITMNTKHTYKYLNPSKLAYNIYPVKTGLIRFDDYRLIKGEEQVMPIRITQNAFYGDLGFSITKRQ